MKSYKTPYRSITMPKCPYCGKEVQYTVDDYDTRRIVALATGTGSSNVVVTCKGCGEKYRVTCNIRYYGRKQA
jgi:RNase P subunit RPR2